MIFLLDMLSIQIIICCCPFEVFSLFYCFLDFVVLRIFKPTDYPVFINPCYFGAAPCSALPLSQVGGEGENTIFVLVISFRLMEKYL